MANGAIYIHLPNFIQPMPFLLPSKDAFAINDVVNSLKQWSKQQIDRIFTENERRNYCIYLLCYCGGFMYLLKFT